MKIQIRDILQDEALGKALDACNMIASLRKRARAVELTQQDYAESLRQMLELDISVQELLDGLDTDSATIYGNDH